MSNMMERAKKTAPLEGSKAAYSRHEKYTTPISTVCLPKTHYAVFDDAYPRFEGRTKDPGFHNTLNTLPPSQAPSSNQL